MTTLMPSVDSGGERARKPHRSRTAVIRPRRRLLRRAVSGVALLFTAIAARAQTPASLRLTLDEATARAIAASHRLAEARARQSASDAVADERHAETLPLASFLGGYYRTNHVDAFGVVQPPGTLQILYPDVPNNYWSRVEMQWPVYSGGRAQALERAARIDATAAADDVTTARADLRLEVARAFWALVTAGEALRVVERSLEQIDAHLRDVRNQFNAGLVPPSDVLNAEAQRAHQRVLSIRAAVDRDVAEADLGRLVDAPSGARIEPAVRLDVAPSGSLSIDALIAEARRQRPDRAALSKRVDAARQRIGAAAAGRRPTLNVAGGYDYARPNAHIFPRADVWKTSWDTGVNVRWPIFDGGRARSEEAEAAAIARAAEERLADVDTAIAVEVRQSVREVESSRAAVDAATLGVASANEARRVLGERFAAGVATSTDVLDAQTALLQAELDRTRAIASARLADALLERALGR